MWRRGGAPRRAARAVPLSSVAARPRQGPWNVARGFSRGKENTNRKAPAGRGKMAHAHILVPVVFLTVEAGG